MDRIGLSVIQCLLSVPEECEECLVICGGIFS